MPSGADNNGYALYKNSAQELSTVVDKNIIIIKKMKGGGAEFNG